MIFNLLIKRGFFAISVLCAAAQGASITWEKGAITGDSDVSLNGTLVTAVNFGAPGVASTTINGVTFDAFAIPRFSKTLTQGITTISAVSAIGAGLTGDNNLASTQTPFSLLSPAYKSLLGSIAETGNSLESLNVTMSSLAVGQTYEFQWWYSLSTVGNVVETALAGNSVQLVGNILDRPGGPGQSAIGRFVADGPTQGIRFTPNTTAQGAINGFQLRNVTSVPEPGSALFGLGLCAVAMIRRRRHGPGGVGGGGVGVPPAPWRSTITRAAR